MTGLLLPGIIEDPTWTAGIRTSPIPPSGPEASRRTSEAIFDSVSAAAPAAAAKHQQRIEVSEGIERILHSPERQTDACREPLDGERAVAGRGAGAGPDRRRPKRPGIQR